MKLKLICLAALTLPAMAATTVTETLPGEQRCFRGWSVWKQPGGVTGCRIAAEADANTRATGTYKYSHGWPSPESRTVWTIKQVKPKVTPAPVPVPSQPVIGVWEHAANEWEMLTMPYDGVASFKDAHPLAERSEITLPAGAQRLCQHDGAGGPFAKTSPPGGLSGRFVCEVHRQGVVVPPPTVSVPMMAQMEGMPKIDPTKIPAPNPLASHDLKVRPTANTVPTGDAIGAFRNQCEFSHINFDDFIVSPRQPGAAHAHVYCGNASANAFSTDVSLAQGATTASGGKANQSAYWMPAMLMPDATRAGYYVPVIPLIWNNYYKTGYNQIPIASIKELPNGLVVIAGSNPMNTKLETADTSNFGFACNDVPSVTIPSCPAGGDITVHGTFPNCWDGKNLDSPDHRSHMAYSGGGVCPSTHPVAVVQLGFHVHYHVLPNTDTSKWKLSCDMGQGGLCSHADAKILWDTAIRDEWMQGCIYSRGDCQANMGKGRELYQ